MFLTQFPICVTRRQSKRILASPYRMHALVAGCFPSEGSTGEEGRILWRVDTGQDGSRTLYIVSPRKPSLVGLDEQIGWPDLEPQWKTRSYDQFLKRIENGQRYAFRLAANPVVDRATMKDERRRSNRLGHVSALQESAWLVGAVAYDQAGVNPPEFIVSQDSSRALRNGFRVCSDETAGLQLVVSGREKKSFRQGAKGRTITIACVQYDGVMEVTDADRLVHTLCFGIGHGKAFGCGLMTVVPIR